MTTDILIDKLRDYFKKKGEAMNVAVHYMEDWFSGKDDTFGVICYTRIGDAMPKGRGQTSQEALDDLYEKLKAKKIID
jgi:hypothetical protein